MKRRHSSTSCTDEGPHKKKACEGQGKKHGFGRFAFVPVVCLRTNVMSAADPGLIPYNAMHAVCAISQTSVHNVHEYRNLPNPVPAMTLLQCVGGPGTTKRCVEGLRAMQELFPFDYSESALLSPSWVDVVKTEDSGRETLVLRELDSQFVAALGTATIIRETVGRLASAPSLALNLCHRIQRRTDIANKLEQQAAHNLWNYVGAYLIVSAELLDTSTSRFTFVPNPPVWRPHQKPPAPKNQSQDAVVRIGDLRGCDPQHNWPMTPRTRAPEASDFRYKGMCEPARKAPAATLSRIPDLLMVMLSAGHLLQWPSDGAACAADDTMVLDTVISWIHAEIVGDQAAAPCVAAPAPNCDPFSRIGPISVRHAVLCMILGSTPHVISDEALHVVQHLCAPAKNLDRASARFRDCAAITAWIRQTRTAYCSCHVDKCDLAQEYSDSDSDSEDDDDDDRVLKRIWHDIPEAILHAVYNVTFDFVLVPTTVLAMRIIDGIRLRNPPVQEQPVRETASYKAAVDRSHITAVLASTKAKRPPPPRSMRTDQLRIAELPPDKRLIPWDRLCAGRSADLRMQDTMRKHSRFLSALVKNTPLHCLQSRASKSIENARHAWYIRTAVVAAVICAYELLACRRVAAASICADLAPKLLLAESELSAKRIALAVASAASAVADFPLCKSFTERTDRSQVSSDLWNVLPTLVSGLPVATR